MYLKKYFLILTTLLPLINSIQIPLVQGQFRCMLVYAFGNDDTVKIDINFPTIDGWSKSDKYVITLRNTKTGKMQTQQHGYGHYRRQIHIYEKVIYQLCFQLISSRQINQEIVVDYEADTHYMLNKQSIKLPQNLLKTQHMRQTYQSVIALRNLTQNYKKLQQQRAKIQQKQFKQTQNVQNKIMVLSIIQIGIILGIGIYQFWHIKSKIQEAEFSTF